jgi:hypothetical protein
VRTPWDEHRSVLKALQGQDCPQIIAVRRRFDLVESGPPALFLRRPPGKIAAVSRANRPTTLVARG